MSGLAGAADPMALQSTVGNTGLECGYPTGRVAFSRYAWHINVNWVRSACSCAGVVSCSNMIRRVPVMAASKVEAAGSVR
jgi:hypothetical protein